MYTTRRNGNLTFYRKQRGPVDGSGKGKDNGGIMPEYRWKAAVVTLSDKGYAGEREDKSGPLVREMIGAAGYDVQEMILLPDDHEEIKKCLLRLCDEDKMDIVFTTGGTGFAPRDCTPEATLAVADRGCGGPECAGDRGGHAGGVHEDHAEGHAEQRRIRDPGTDADHQSAGQPEGGAGESGSHPSLTGSRTCDPDRARRGVRTMTDQFGRTINYMRVSVTDRCNLRCVYCMPPEGVPCLSHRDILTYDEITRVCRIGAGLGISRIKLTGGEPLVRNRLRSRQMVYY